MWSSKRCPNFTGVAENGSRADFNMGGGKIIAIYRNGVVLELKNTYNWSEEEWEETIIKTYTGQEKENIIKELNIDFVSLLLRLETV